ncbi:DUF2267 domain-containing protein [Streptomonospora wellingtoniae]|uniref:Putative pterin-4-alpha-carbinolamine dehydratase n=1 Tax=Streptomonospora wellingtoniae TaxID=3075544 RepID=A0ABU2KQY1_9ACTN|nr:DUF2267 domain-containing protein [Streptomonospora sp. DSM 45055]MDT0301696.1 DUF2267 domain-containing protein [Streptomonospora sp. DSM 45055]
MVAHQQLVERVAAHGEVGDTDRAGRAIRAVVPSIARRLDEGTRRELHDSLPESLWIEPPHAQDPEIERVERASGTSGIAQQVAGELGCLPEEGLHLARVVLAEIARSEPGISAGLAAALPEDLARWTADPTGARGRADTGITGEPSRLDKETLDAALERLPEWEGGTEGLSRTVQIPADRLPPLLARIDRISDRAGRRAHHARTAGGIRFTVRTASVGAVTTADIDLAESIDQAVAEVGSGG